jgi:hypothetical protein
LDELGNHTRVFYPARLSCWVDAAVVPQTHGIAVAVFDITIENVVVIVVFCLLCRRWDLIVRSLRDPHYGLGVGVLVQIGKLTPPSIDKPVRDLICDWKSEGNSWIPES